MDFLNAYSRINDLESLATLNGIHVPRLRGYRLMFEQNPLSSEEIDDLVVNMTHEIYERGCRSVPRFCPDSSLSEFSVRTNYIKKKYLDENGELRWDLLHGKRRKNMKFAVKKMKRAVRQQYQTFNKYVGMPDILYIHARIGGQNWDYYQGYLLEKAPWFLEKVDDCFDETYCDIYAKIDKWS